MEDVEKVKALVLRELIKKGKFGGAHTPLENITSRLPDIFLHNKKGQKAIDRAVQELVNLLFVIIMKKRTGKGSDLHISINPRKSKEIGQYLLCQK
jgi:hypothetical protein